MVSTFVEATSEAEVFARREAAKMMYQVLTDAEYKDSPYAIGQGCQALTGGTIKRPVMSAYVSLNCFVLVFKSI